MKEVRLNNGVMMPAIGFGVFQIPENGTCCKRRPRNGLPPDRHGGCLFQ